MVRTHRFHQAFTIVELIVIIVVIALLAIVTTVAYNGMTYRAHEASLKSDLKNAHSQIEADRKKANGVYPSDNTAVNEGKGFATSDGNTLTYFYNPTTRTFCIQGNSSHEDVDPLHLLANGKIVSGTCS